MTSARSRLAIVLALAGVLVAAGVRAAGARADASRPSRATASVLVSFALVDGLTADMRDAIQSGLATTFAYDVELRRAAATWFDRTLASLTVTASVRFDNLTRRYQLARSVDGRVEDAAADRGRDEVRQLADRVRARAARSRRRRSSRTASTTCGCAPHARPREHLVLLAVGATASITGRRGSRSSRDGLRLQALGPACRPRSLPSRRDAAGARAGAAARARPLPRQPAADPRRHRRSWSWRSSAILALANRSPRFSPDFLTEFVLYALSAVDLTMLVGAGVRAGAQHRQAGGRAPARPAVRALPREARGAAARR